jgi:hypothetical protein
VINCMVKSVETELQQTVRAEIHKQKKAARPGAMQQGSGEKAHVKIENAPVPDGAYRLTHPDGHMYNVLLLDGKITWSVQVVEGQKRKGGLKINMGPRPVVGELFSDEDMAGGQ